MSNILCPNCNQRLLIEPYTIPLPGTKVLGVSSRLVCKACNYKKEPKKVNHAKHAAIMRLAEREAEAKGGE